MAWRVAKSLEVFRKQMNELSPNRNKLSDGTIGDAAHASRTSDHNPWVKDGRMGIVTALDITHDPARGVDTHKMAEILRQNRDPRIKYVISNYRIFNSNNWTWRKYTGSNPHSKHIHISVSSDKSRYDDESLWDLGQGVVERPVEEPQNETEAPAATNARPMLRRKSKGPEVRKLQELLIAWDYILEADGIFGWDTDLAVRDFQRYVGIPADGIVGPYTWEKLEEE